MSVFNDEEDKKKELMA